MAYQYNNFSTPMSSTILYSLIRDLHNTIPSSNYEKQLQTIQQQIQQIEEQINQTSEIDKTQLIQQQYENDLNQFQQNQTIQYQNAQQQIINQNQQTFNESLQNALQLYQQILINVKNEFEKQLQNQKQQLIQRKQFANVNEVKQKVVQIKQKFETHEDGFGKAMEDYSQTQQFKSLFFEGNLENNMHGKMSYCPSVLSKIHFKVTFAVEYIRDYYTYTEEFKKCENTWCMLSYYNVMSINKDNTILRYDFGMLSTHHKQVNGQTLEQQFQEATIQQSIFNGAQTTEDHNKQFGDLCIHPQIKLKLFQEEWLFACKALEHVFSEKNGQFEAQKIFMFDFASLKDCSQVRLFKSLKQVLQEMVQVIDVKEYSEALKDKEFDLSWLMEQPHIFCLRTVVRMNQMVQAYEEKITDELIREQEKVKFIQSEEYKQQYEQIEKQLKQECAVETIKQLQEKFNLQLPQMDAQQLVDQYQKLLEEKIKRDFELQKEQQINELVQQQQRELEEFKQKYDKQLNQFKIPLQQIEQLKNEAAELFKNNLEVMNLRHINILEQLYHSKIKNLKKAQQHNEQSVLNMSSGSIGKKNVCICQMLYDSHVPDVQVEKKVVFDVEEAKKISEEVEKLCDAFDDNQIKLKFEEKEYIPQMLLNKLLQKNSSVILTIPINSSLSPFSKNSKNNYYSSTYEFYVLNQDSKLVSILINNVNNLGRQKLVKEEINPEFIVEPKMIKIKDIPRVKENKLQVTNLSTKNRSIHYSDVVDFEEGSTVEDALINIANDNCNLRDILFVGERNVEKFKNFFKEAQLGYNYVGFTIQKDRIDLLNLVFPTNEKLIISRVLDNYTVLVGKPKIMLSPFPIEKEEQLVKEVLKETQVEKVKVKKIDVEEAKNKINRISNSLHQVGNQQANVSNISFQLQKLFEKSLHQNQNGFEDQIEKIMIPKNEIVNNKQQMWNQDKMNIVKQKTIECGNRIVQDLEKMKK